jgi:hypothetical protein
LRETKEQIGGYCLIECKDGLARAYAERQFRQRTNSPPKYGGERRLLARWH